MKVRFSKERVAKHPEILLCYTVEEEGGAVEVKTRIFGSI